MRDKVEVNNSVIPPAFRGRKGEWTSAVVLKVEGNCFELRFAGGNVYWVMRGDTRPLVRYTRFERRVMKYIDRELNNG